MIRICWGFFGIVWNIYICDKGKKNRRCLPDLFVVAGLSTESGNAFPHVFFETNQSANIQNIDT